MHVHVRSSLLDGHDIRVVTVADITEHMSVRRELLAVKDKQKLALETTGAGVWEIDVANHTIEFDSSCHRLLGFPDGSLNGSVEVLDDSMHPDDAQPIADDQKESNDDASS